MGKGFWPSNDGELLATFRHVEALPLWLDSPGLKCRLLSGRRVLLKA